MGIFKTKARAIELLGKKQIRDSVTGLSEIMKNSYDADASILRVEFNTKRKNPYILIYDTGRGMDEYDLENKWLVLGTESKKVSKKEKTPEGRTLMGEKGIGRLAVAKLGQQTIIISKTQNSKWNMLFLNWNIFENPLLMIDDVVIPSKYGFEYNDIGNIIQTLTQEQKNNLSNITWQKEHYKFLYNRIKYQLENLDFDINSLKDVCEFIEDYNNQGTAILISDLNENWDKYLNAADRDSNSDQMTDKNYHRLASFISDFQHVDKKFAVEIFYNSKILEFNYDYEEKDYAMCDLVFEGYIEKGSFFGKLSARNADQRLLDECNQQLDHGLEVTAGLNNWEEYDCGKFNVKFCHVELDPKKSGLTPEEFDQIKNKMSISGGVAVYRDNVRILPYGEVENDFLGMEGRRTKHAGTYLFSHRNMFGRIDITSENNPMLEDKSSREGFIENEQFFYFITTLQNLLINMAKKYVGDASNSKKLRKSYIEYNQEIAEKKRREAETEKAEKIRQKEYIKLLLNKYKNNQDSFMKAKIVIHNGINELIIGYKPNDNMSYTLLNNLKDSLKSSSIKLKHSINAMKNYEISIDKRYLAFIEEDVVDNIEILNDEIQQFIEDEKDNINKVMQNKEQEVMTFIDNWWKNAAEGFSGTPIQCVNELNSDLSKTIKNLDSYSYNLQEYCNQREENVHSKTTIIERINKEISDIVHSALNEKFAPKSQDIRSQLLDMQKICNNLLDMKPQDMQKERKLIYIKMLENQHRMEDYYFETIKYIEQHFDRLDAKGELLEFYASSDNAQDVNNLIGVLKQKNIELESQLEVYTELANFGLSAEMVNHEFNQLFTNVYDAIKQMKYEPLTNNVKYLLNQVEIGFRAISDRQSQLSPMYRSRNINKKPISIKGMIDDIYNFFEEKLKNNNIKFINDVPGDIKIILSLSKIYPVLSNLIYNSIYWVTDRNERKILFHFNTDENTLYVEDSGPGIPLKHIKEIFDPFFSLRPDGRGLGLTIAKKVLESQGHMIDAIDEGDSKLLKGACFRIHFNYGMASNERGE